MGHPWRNGSVIEAQSTDNSLNTGHATFFFHSLNKVSHQIESTFDSARIREIHYPTTIEDVLNSLRYRLSNTEKAKDDHDTSSQETAYNDELGDESSLSIILGGTYQHDQKKTRNQTIHLTYRHQKENDLNAKVEGINKIDHSRLVSRGGSFPRNKRSKKTNWIKRLKKSFTKLRKRKERLLKTNKVDPDEFTENEEESSHESDSAGHEWFFYEEDKKNCCFSDHRNLKPMRNEKQKTHLGVWNKASSCSTDTHSDSISSASDYGRSFSLGTSSQDSSMVSSMTEETFSVYSDITEDFEEDFGDQLDASISKGIIKSLGLCGISNFLSV